MSAHVVPVPADVRTGWDCPVEEVRMGSEDASQAARRVSHCRLVGCSEPAAGDSGEESEWCVDHLGVIRATRERVVEANTFVRRGRFC